MAKRRQLRGFDLRQIEGVAGLIGVDEAGRGRCVQHRDLFLRKLFAQHSDPAQMDFL